MEWHDLPVSAAAETLGTDTAVGLSSAEARRRLRRLGRNRPVAPPAAVSPLHRWLNACFSPRGLAFGLVFALAALLLLFKKQGGLVQTVGLGLLWPFDALLRAADEQRCRRETDALQRESEPTACVLRDGLVSEIPAALVTVGDILLLRSGDRIAADGRLVDSLGLRCDETALFGPGGSGLKNPYAALAEATPLRQRVNCVFAAAKVVEGSGKVIVTAVGGQCAAATRLRPPPVSVSPLGRTLQVAQKSALSLFWFLCAAAVVLAFALKKDLSVSLLLPLAAVASGVSLFPHRRADEAFSALGAELSETGLTVKNPASLERLADVTVICTELDRVAVRREWSLSELYTRAGPEDPARPLSPAATALLKLAALACEPGKQAARDESNLPVDPAEAALLGRLAETGFDPERVFDEYRVRFTFRTSGGARAVLCENRQGRALAVAFGTADSVLPLCRPASAENLQRQADEWKQRGLRPFAAAVGQLAQMPVVPVFSELESNFDPAGLFGFLSRLGSGGPAFSAACRKAGLRPLILTAAPLLSAVAAARRCGLLADDARVLGGEQLEEMSEAELDDEIASIDLFGQLDARARQRVIRALERAGERVVSVSGSAADLADCPALTAAPLPACDGAARAEADLLLSEGCLAALPAAVSRARTVCGNLKRGFFAAVIAGLVPWLPVFAAALLTETAPPVLLLCAASALVSSLCVPALFGQRLAPRGPSAVPAAPARSTWIFALCIGLYVLAAPVVGFFVSGLPAAVLILLAEIPPAVWCFQGAGSLFGCRVNRRLGLALGLTCALLLAGGLCFAQPLGFTAMKAESFGLAAALAPGLLPVSELVKLALSGLRRKESESL